MGPAPGRRRTRQGGDGRGWSAGRRGQPGRVAAATPVGRPRRLTPWCRGSALCRQGVSPRCRMTRRANQLGQSADQAGAGAVSARACSIATHAKGAGQRQGDQHGLVMIEAMACGTPIIAFRHGSVPEVIEDVVSGWIVDDEAAGIEAVRQANKLDRHRVREAFERRFTVVTMADITYTFIASLHAPPGTSH